MKRLQLSAADRERLQSGPVTVRRAMRPEPGKDIVLVCPGFYSDKYWRDHWLAAGYEMRCYNMEPARRPPFLLGEVVYVPEEWWFRGMKMGVQVQDVAYMDGATLIWHVYSPPKPDDPWSDACMAAWGWKKRVPASMPAWVARLHARCVSVEAVKGERWEWVAVFERCVPGEEDDA